MITRRSLLIRSAAASAVIATPFVARAAAIPAKIAHAAAESHPAHITCLEFKKALEELAPGAFQLQIFPNRQLGDDKQNLESAMAGVLEFAGVSGATFPAVTGRQALNAWQLPFLVKDYAHFEKLALSPQGQALLDDLAPAGIVGLTTVDIGQRHFLSATHPVTKLPDFAGLKTRIVPVPLHKQIWETIGTAPIGLPYGEIYGALETKVLDALEINVSSIIGENLWEVGKNFTLTGHYPWHNLVIANQVFFEGLSPDLQQAVREAGRRAVAPTLAYTKKQDEDGRAFLTEKGVTISELEDLPAFKEKLSPLVSEWAAKDPLIGAFVSAAQAET
ncbi:TRAP transporter substrate-binding protein [Frigidibacter sp. MR17.14]|uniref:TRAP transporter substrate-binding protein n=1 Tax=Frigidibacter sp. MR17.14 TaxID=3126509 RepID=UPI0030131226